MVWMHVNVFGIQARKQRHKYHIQTANEDVIEQLHVTKMFQSIEGFFSFTQM